MHYNLENNYSKYFYILNIFIFIVTVGYADNITTSTTTVDENHFKLRNIRTYSLDQWEEFCASFNTILADVDVLFNGTSNVNKTHVKALKQFENANKKLIFYTTTMDATNNLTEKLKTLGYTTEFELFNPISALKWYFEKSSFSGKAYVIGDTEFEAMIKSLDIETIYPPNEVTYDDYITGYNDTFFNDVKAVIIGFDVNINLFKITQALRFLANPKVQLFLIQKKSIYESNYYNVWIKKLIMETNRTKQYIDRLDGIFGDFLVEKNNLKDLKDHVLCVTSNASGNLIFTMKNNFKPLLIGSYKVKKEVTLPSMHYYVTNIARIPACPNDE